MYKMGFSGKLDKAISSQIDIISVIKEVITMTDIYGVIHTRHPCPVSTNAYFWLTAFLSLCGRPLHMVMSDSIHPLASHDLIIKTQKYT